MSGNHNKVPRALHGGRTDLGPVKDEARKVANRGLRYDLEPLYVDLGLSTPPRSANERFEIDGANEARRFLEQRGIPEASVMTVWEAIALHTTPEALRYKQPEVALNQAGVELDVLGQGFDDVAPEIRDQVVAAHPRTGVCAITSSSPNTAQSRPALPPTQRTDPSRVRGVDVKWISSTAVTRIPAVPPSHAWG